MKIASLATEACYFLIVAEGPLFFRLAAIIVDLRLFFNKLLDKRVIPCAMLPKFREYVFRLDIF